MTPSPPCNFGSDCRRSNPYARPALRSRSPHYREESDMIRYPLAWLTIALLLPSLLGCGGGSSNPATNRSIVGNWRTTFLRSGSLSTTCPGRIEVMPNFTMNCDAQPIIFRTDGTVTTSEGPGTYTLNGNNLTIATPNDSVTGEINFQDDNT